MQYIFQIFTATDVLSSNVFDKKSHLSLSLLIRLFFILCRGSRHIGAIYVIAVYWVVH